MSGPSHGPYADNRLEPSANSHDQVVLQGPWHTVAFFMTAATVWFLSVLVIGGIYAIATRSWDGPLGPIALVALLPVPHLTWWAWVREQRRQRRVGMPF